MIMEPAVILCAHADIDGAGAHWRPSGSACSVGTEGAEEIRAKIGVDWNARSIDPEWEPSGQSDSVA